LVAGEDIRKDAAMLSQRSPSRSAESQSNELLNELVRNVEWICRRCPENLRGEVAHEELLQLRPRVQEALAALEDVEERRGLTEEEHVWQRVFKLLLGAER
jgi:hypothetical protein